MVPNYLERRQNATLSSSQFTDGATITVTPSGIPSTIITSSQQTQSSSYEVSQSSSSSSQSSQEQQNQQAQPTYVLTTSDLPSQPVFSPVEEDPEPEPAPTRAPPSTYTALTTLTDNPGEGVNTVNIFSITHSGSANATDPSSTEASPFLSNKPAVAVCFTVAGLVLFSGLIIVSLWFRKRLRHQREGRWWKQVDEMKDLPAMGPPSLQTPSRRQSIATSGYSILSDATSLPAKPSRAPSVKSPPHSPNTPGAGLGGFDVWGFARNASGNIPVGLAVFGNRTAPGRNPTRVPYSLSPRDRFQRLNSPPVNPRKDSHVFAKYANFSREKRLSEAPDEGGGDVDPFGRQNAVPVALPESAVLPYLTPARPAFPWNDDGTGRAL